MVAIRFFRDGQIIGAKEFTNEEKAVEVGETWYRKAKRNYPALEYHFELIKPVFIVSVQKSSASPDGFKRFESFTDMICYKDKIPNAEIISRITRFDERHFANE